MWACYIEAGEQTTQRLLLLPVSTTACELSLFSTASVIVAVIAVRMRCGAQSRTMSQVRAARQLLQARWLLSFTSGTVAPLVAGSVGS
jgi:hypothetical protein